MPQRDTRIHIVLPWVDPSDPQWQARRAQWQGGAGDDREIRYRDWETLRYLFRGIDRFAPWVEKVHFVTCGHLPPWLDTQEPRLHVVRHEDYIPERFLPTFNSHTIELNMHRIPGLSEQFIYFNDDIFLLRPVKPEDFFRQGLPCDANIPNLIVPVAGNFSPIVFNCVAAINARFSKRAAMKASPGKSFDLRYGGAGLLRCLLFAPWPLYTGFYNPHLALPYLRSTLEEVWAAEPELLEKSSLSRFRDSGDVNQYIFRYWQLAAGRFRPHALLGKYFKVSQKERALLDYIRRRRGAMVCVNDDELSQEDFLRLRRALADALEAVLPDKCPFER